MGENSYRFLKVLRCTHRLIGYFYTSWCKTDITAMTNQCKTSFVCYVLCSFSTKTEEGDRGNGSVGVYEYY